MADGSTMLSCMSVRELAPGIYSDVPADLYHRREPGVASKSALDLVHRSPAHLKQWIDGKIDEESAAFRFGKAFHCALLEPEIFAKTYVVKPTFKGKGSKARKEEWEAENAHVLTIDMEDKETIEGMIRAVRSQPIASEMLRDGEPEATLIWDDEATGLRCKARADYLIRDAGVVIDVKTTDDARAESFKKSVANYRYHVQSAHYLEGLIATLKAPAERFVFVAVEKEPPFNTAIFMLDAKALTKGQDLRRADMALLAACVDTGIYPGYDESIQLLSLPPWAA